MKRSFPSLTPISVSDFATQRRPHLRTHWPIACPHYLHGIRAPARSQTAFLNQPLKKISRAQRMTTLNPRRRCWTSKVLWNGAGIPKGIKRSALHRLRRPPAQQINKEQPTRMTIAAPSTMPCGAYSGYGRRGGDRILPQGEEEIYQLRKLTKPIFSD